MPNATVLVGFAEALAAPEVVWSLVDAGFNVTAFARRGRRSSLRHSRHVLCYDICPPELDLNAALSELRALLGSLRTERDNPPLIFFPLDDKAVWLSSTIQHDDRWIVAGPQGNCVELALNKRLQTVAAQSAGFNVPKTLFARTAKEIFDFSSTETFPIILRPAECVPIYRHQFHSCPKWICADYGELERAVTQWSERIPLLVQPYIPGTGEGVFGLAASDGIKFWSAHRRLRMMNPHGSGSSACVSEPLEEELKSKVEALITRVGWRGLFMVEILRDRFRTPWFIELNGRPWGSMALSRRQGLEYPAWHVRVATNQESCLGFVPAPTGGMVCRNLGRELMHLLFVFRGARSKALTDWPPLWKSVREVITTHRGDTFYNWRRDDPKVFITDCYYTFCDNVFKRKPVSKSKTPEFQAETGGVSEQRIPGDHKQLASAEKAHEITNSIDALTSK
jgi:hypothetical protein